MSSGGTLAKHDMQGISFASGGEKVGYYWIYNYSYKYVRVVGKTSAFTAFTYISIST